MTELSDKPMADPADFTDEQWRDAAILDKGDHIPTAKERFALPVRDPDGTLNRTALQEAAETLHGPECDDLDPLVKSIVAGHLGARFAEAGLPVRKSVLSAADRRALPDSDYVFPAEKAYPIPDLAHARNALARGAQNETGERLAKIRSAVKAKFPDIDVSKAEAGEDFDMVVPLLKDDAKQIVYGPVLTPGLRDSQGDIATAEEIEKAAHNFLTAYRQQNHDVQHSDVYKNDKGEPIATTVESFIAPQDMFIGGEKVLKGAWVMAAKIHDPEVWDQVRKGEITGFSITGIGRRQPEGAKR